MKLDHDNALNQVSDTFHLDRRVLRIEGKVKDRLRGIRDRVIDTARRMKWAYQRVRRGWDETITWSLDAAHARWVIETIDEFQKVSSRFVGPPSTIIARHTDDLFNPDDEAIKAAEDEWNQILQDIRDGFQAYLDFDDLDWRTPEEWKHNHKAMRKKLRRAFALMYEHYEALWW